MQHNDNKSIVDNLNEYFDDLMESAEDNSEHAIPDRTNNKDKSYTKNKPAPRARGGGGRAGGDFKHGILRNPWDLAH